MWLLRGALSDDFDAHTAGGACDNFDATFKIDGVELIFLDFGDFFELCASNLAYLVGVRFATSLFDVGALTDHVVNGLTQ